MYVAFRVFQHGADWQLTNPSLPCLPASTSLASCSNILSTSKPST